MESLSGMSTISRSGKPSSCWLQDFPLILAPEIVAHEESASQQ
jgi:hypothetical protein